MRDYYTLLVYYCVSDSQAKEEEIRTMEGGSSYDSLPHDIILHIFSYIFSRLPLDCVFRLKCVCKAWSVLISDFEALHLKRLRETSRGIICLHTHRDSRDCKISFEIRSLYVGGGFKILLKKKTYSDQTCTRGS